MSEPVWPLHASVVIIISIIITAVIWVAEQSCSIFSLFSISFTNFLIKKWSECEQQWTIRLRATTVQYLMSVLFWATYAVQMRSTKVYVLSTRTFIGVRLSGRRRSLTLRSLVWVRFTFSFCKQLCDTQYMCMHRYKCESAAHPVHYSKVHPHDEYPGREMNTFGQIAQELMIETLYPICVSAL